MANEEKMCQGKQQKRNESNGMEARASKAKQQGLVGEHRAQSRATEHDAQNSKQARTFSGQGGSLSDSVSAPMRYD